MNTPTATWWQRPTPTGWQATGSLTKAAAQHRWMSTGNGLAASLQGGASFSANHAPLLFAAPYALQSSPGAGALVDDAPSLNPVNELTVAAWVRLNSSAGTQPIVSKLAGDQAGPGYALLVRDSLLAAEAWDSPQPAARDHEQYHNRHVAACSNDLQNDWRNGGLHQRAPGRHAAAPDTLAVSSAPLQMAVDGALDDVRIYNRALSAGAVAALAGGRSCVTAGTTWADAAPDLQCALIGGSGRERSVGGARRLPAHARPGSQRNFCHRRRS